MIDLLFLVFFLASPQYYNYWVYFFPLLFSVFHYVYVPQVRQPKWVAWNLASRTFSPLGSSVYSIKWMHATYLAISVHETCKNVTSNTASLLGLAKTGEIHGLWQEARTRMTCTMQVSRLANIQGVLSFSRRERGKFFSADYKTYGGLQYRQSPQISGREQNIEQVC